MEQSRVVHAPNVLVVRVQRMLDVAVEGQGRRLARYDVAVEEDLDLPDFPRMTLSGVIYHNGETPCSGHYTCACRGRDGQWWYFDDERVRPVGVEVASFKTSQVHTAVYVRADGRQAWRVGARAGEAGDRAPGGVAPESRSDAGGEGGAEAHAERDRGGVPGDVGGLGSGGARRGGCGEGVDGVPGSGRRRLRGKTVSDPDGEAAARATGAGSSAGVGAATVKDAGSPGRAGGRPGAGGGGAGGVLGSGRRRLHRKTISDPDGDAAARATAAEAAAGSGVAGRAGDGIVGSGVHALGQVVPGEEALAEGEVGSAGGQASEVARTPRRTKRKTPAETVRNPDGGVCGLGGAGRATRSRGAGHELAHTVEALEPRRRSARLAASAAVVRGGEASARTSASIVGGVVQRPVRATRREAQGGGGLDSRGRVVTGFGESRIDDLGAFQDERDARDCRVALERKREGGRGACVDLQGDEVDRSHGGPSRIGGR